MSTSNTSWDDTGFDDEAGGFKSSHPHVEKTPPEVEPHSSVEPAPLVEPTPTSPPQHYTRVEPQPITAPPVETRRSRWGTVFLIAALLLIVIAVGYIVSTFFMRDPTEQEAFFANPDTSRQEATAPPVDTVTVAATPAVIPTSNDSTIDSSPRQIASTMRPKKTPPDEAPDKPSRPPASIDPPAAKTPSTNALYVVQVFSSPSRDDADEWLQILRERNVSDGFITEQRLGGEAWYRVRFGQYGSRQDAETAAQQLGFSNPWIARVR